MRYVPMNELMPWLPLPPYLVADERADEIGLALRAAGFAVADLDGGSVHDDRALLAAAGTALQLPEHYGRNWDALTDCVTDLPDEGRPRVALLWRHGHHLLERDVHAFVRAVTLLGEISADASALRPDANDPPGQFEVFVTGRFATAP